MSWQRPWEKQQELDGGGQHSTDLLGVEGQLGHVEAQRQTYEWETHTGTPVRRQMANAKFQLWLNYWIFWAQPSAATPSKHFDSSKCCCHSIHSLVGHICGLSCHYKPEPPSGPRHLSTEQEKWPVLHLDLRTQNTLDGLICPTYLTMPNSITETSRNNLSDTNKPGTLHNDMLRFTSKDNAPNLTSVRQIQNVFLWCCHRFRLFYSLAEGIHLWASRLMQKRNESRLLAVPKPTEQA